MDRYVLSGVFLFCKKTKAYEYINHYNFIRSQSEQLNKELPNSSTLSNLGSTALYLIATLPDDEKQEQIEKIEQGESPTVRKLQEIKRRLKLKDQALEAVKGELERVKQTKATEKIIEKEVIPHNGLFSIKDKKL